MIPESAEDFHARIAAACDDEGRLTVALEEMPGWDIYPYEMDSLRMKPLHPLADAEAERRGEDPAACWCAAEERDDSRVVWFDDAGRWRIVTMLPARLPAQLVLEPIEHCDLADVPAHLHAELGQLTVEVSAAVEALPSVGRTHLARFGDGSAHLHLFYFGRPARILQLRGSPMLDWEENLPEVPEDVVRANASYVVDEVVRRVGGRRGPWLAS